MYCIFLLFLLMWLFVFEIVVCLFLFFLIFLVHFTKQCTNLWVTYKLLTKCAKFAKSRRALRQVQPMGGSGAANAAALAQPMAGSGAG